MVGANQESVAVHDGFRIEVATACQRWGVYLVGDNGDRVFCRFVSQETLMNPRWMLTSF